MYKNGQSDYQIALDLIGIRPKFLIPGHRMLIRNYWMPECRNTAKSNRNPDISMFASIWWFSIGVVSQEVLRVRIIGMKTFIFRHLLNTLWFSSLKCIEWSSHCKTIFKDSDATSVSVISHVVNITISVWNVTKHIDIQRAFVLVSIGVQFCHSTHP